MTGRLEGKVALITGVGTGIGGGIAERFAAEGAAVVCTGRSVGPLENVVKRIRAAGGTAMAAELDVTAEAAWRAVVEQAVGEFGGLDVLVNNAGITARTPALEVTLEEWNEIFRVNVTGALLMSQQVARHLVSAKRGGCIINIASTHGLIGFPQRLSYGTSKGALIQMTRMLAIEWAPHDIRVNAIAPGTVETASRNEFFAANPATHQAMLRRVPVGRFATPDEVAGMVSYLASPAAAYVTGQTLILDGGLTAA